MVRFDGKPLISTKVSDGINKAQELIERALSGNAPVYHSKGGATEEGGASSDGDTIGRKIYKSLMIGDLKMGMGALQTHYDIIEQALADQSLYELSSIA